MKQDISVNIQEDYQLKGSSFMFIKKATEIKTLLQSHSHYKLMLFLYISNICTHLNWDKKKEKKQVGDQLPQKAISGSVRSITAK